MKRKSITILRSGQKVIATLLSVCLLSGLLTGCDPAFVDSINASLEAATEQISQATGLETGAVTGTEEGAAQASAFPMDPSVMKPWINSNIIGMVTDDVNADLKDDFYLNVNHDWLKDVKLRPGHSDELPLYDAVDIVKNRCIEILKDDTLTGEDADRIQNYYDLWLDWDSRNAEGVSPILPFAEKIEAVSALDEMSALLVSEEACLWRASLANVGLSVNSDDSSLYEVNIASTSLSLGDAAEYKELTENGKRTKALVEKQYSYMLSRIGLSDTEIEDTISAVFDFEARIAAFMKSTLEWSDASALKESINPVTMEDIKILSPNYPLAEYMENNGWAVSKLINLNEPEWLLGLNEVYTEENLPEIKAYILCHFAGSLIGYIDEDAYRTMQKIEMEFSGATSVEPDEELAYSETRSLFSGCFGRIYVERYLNEEIREEIRTLCQDAIDTYDEMFETVEWLSEETRKEAQNKLRNITIHAVYPDKWEDDSMYHVTAKKDGGSYLNALKEYFEANHEDALSKLNGKVDKELWGMDILETNAFYKPTDNSINIIPGFFCDVTYRSDMSLEEKYGALGTVIGHEISHAFDTNGAQYDAEGNVKKWWTDEDYVAFSDRAKKLISYYDQVVPFDDGTPYHGQLVQTEAIADMAGLKCMLKMADKVDGFDYDKFFRANCLMWARAGTKEVMEYFAATDVHPLHYLRANVSVSQYDEFIETYGIKEGDGMYVATDDRIAVW